MTTYRAAPGVLSEEMDGNVMLIDESSAELITLNRVGSVVWETLAAGEATLDHSVRAVLVEFPDAPRDAVTADVASFVEQLATAGLVIVEP